MTNNPTKEQFLSNPRAKELRQICLDIAGATDRILHGSNVDEHAEYVELERMNGKLIELGITPHMHTGLEQEAYENPIVVAEYVAGQWMDELGRQFPSEESAVSIVQQHGGGKGIHPDVKDFVTMQSFVNVTYRFLDAE